VKDAVHIKENSKSVAELTAKFDAEKKDKENDILIKEKKNEELAANRQRLISAISIALLWLLIASADFPMRSYNIPRLL